MSSSPSTRFSLTRRHFLAGSAALAVLPPVLRAGPAAAATAPLEIVAERRIIDVGGRAAPVFRLAGPGGRPGIVLEPGAPFRAVVKNRTGQPTIIHWHGQTPPPEQDGVTDTGFAGLIADGGEATYDFAPRTGTHWMHSHHGLQEQSLLAAPMIVKSADDARLDAEDVVVLLSDFSFRTPEEILAGLGGSMNHGSMAGGGAAMPGMDHGTAGSGMADSGMAGMNMAGMNHDGMSTGGMSMDGMDHGGMDLGSMASGGMASGGMDHGGMPMGGMAGTMDLNDVAYDAFLANDRTLADPQVVRLERNGRVRLRIINGASATNFHIDLGPLAGSLIAVDGNPVVPLTGSRFPLALGQRIDLLVTPPAGACAVFAVREGDKARTGIVLATPGAAIPRLAETADAVSPPLDAGFEARLSPAAGGVAADEARPLEATLGGAMMPYRWTINGAIWQDRKALPVTARTTARVTFANRTGMSHPMHLHGHHFQVVAIDGRPLAGAMRDTVLVAPGSTVTVAFAADNPGRWLLHCHNLYHMASGMMTEVAYAA
ncbi:multicopper oxidase domain-containing protein [Pseudoxanthobacter sp.]|uniref:multicopper oxidase family protein n=1 Tax=Pseudoxanthobacter sp. TaxID=1925742 RepID=UPI002FE03FFB